MNETGCTGTTGLCCSGAVGMEAMPGSCIICGLSNYPLSAGGPTICPSCDCGDFGFTKIERQRKEIERLRQRNKNLIEILRAVERYFSASMEER